MQSSNSIIIKGVREGLLFILDDDVPFSRVLTELTERISARQDFFRGASITINAGNRIMDRPDFDVIYKMLTRYGMRVQTFVSLSAQSRMIAEGFGVTSRPPSFAAGDAGESLGPRGRDVVASHGSPPPGHASPFPGPSDAPVDAEAGIFVRRNIRPGESVRYGGDVCVLGDVEVGAEIVASGDIVIWGALLGAAHAGVNGDDGAVVCALYMSPTQLAIADCLSRFPAQEVLYPVGAEWGGEATSAFGEDQNPNEARAKYLAGSRVGARHASPLLARVESGRIVVEAWRGDYAEDNNDTNTTS